MNRVAIFMMLFAGFNSTVLAQGDSEFGKYRLSYVLKYKEKDVFGNDVEREKNVVSKETLANLSSIAKKRYASSVQIYRDKSVNNFAAVAVSDYAKFKSFIDDILYIKIVSNVDFRKFNNQPDILKLFKSCTQTTSMHCDRKKKTCEYNEYNDELKCVDNKYTFSDLKKSDAITIYKNSFKFVDLIHNKSNSELFRICEKYIMVKEENNSDLNERIDGWKTEIEPVKKILPLTPIYSEDKCFNW